MCEENNCSPIVAYIDKSHMSATFNETFRSILRKDVIEISKDNR